MARTIGDMFFIYGSDKEHPDGHSYGAVYQELLAPVRDRVKTVLELGVQSGASLKAWAEFFPTAGVFGIDNNTSGETNGRIHTHKADATDKSALDEWLLNLTFDLIVDDASHWEGDQLKSFEILNERLVPGGLYVVEDIQCVESHDKFRSLGFEIHDMRAERGRFRFDNVLAVYRRPTNQ